jgi:hypothetical protein
MITYVNTVLVSNKNNSAFVSADNIKANADKDAFTSYVGAPVFLDMVAGEVKDTPAATAEFKLGVVTDKVTPIRKKDGSVEYVPVIKYSNTIQSKALKSIAEHKYAADVEDVVEIDFSSVATETQNLWAEGGCAVSLRLTFKDMPTRYRKWTETYSYVTEEGDTPTIVAEALTNQINKEYRRARVSAVKDGQKITITALKYDDDEQAVTENVYAKVRFDATMYYTNSKAPGFAANNKYNTGVTIKKTEGTTSATSAKLVRDRERAAFDYSGVLHRCCWFDPQPAMITDINNKYAGVTVEFENHYHTADDLMRQTKQCVEFYVSDNGAAGDTIAAKIFDAVKACATAYAPSANVVEG